MSNLVALQMTSSPNVTDNLQAVNTALANLTVNEPTLVVLPECFACFGGGDKGQLAIAETFGEGPIQLALYAMAKRYGVWLVAGSMPIRTEQADKFTATCLLINDCGEMVNDYQKIHLFDVQVGDNTGRYLESRYTEPGNKLVVQDTPFGKLGLAVCYDLRFAGLFQAMSQLGPLDVLALPAAFTYKTGLAHWHALLGTRAIENQCYVVAANQTGEHANKRQTYGHSCIMSPWGENLCEITNQPGVIQTRLDLSLVAQIRRDMPVNHHNKFRSYLV
ncbi:MAG: putative amidohydrolase [Paraglaciecola sp.]|jgi:predicted amidohydrolase